MFCQYWHQEELQHYNLRLIVSLVLLDFYNHVRLRAQVIICFDKSLNISLLLRMLSIVCIVLWIIYNSNMDNENSLQRRGGGGCSDLCSCLERTSSSELQRNY